MYGGPGPSTSRPKSRKGLLIGLVVAGVLVLLAAVGVVAVNVLGSSSSYNVGSCVKQDGDEAKQVDCDESGAFSVVSKEARKEDCADTKQPFVLIERGGKTEVLCLKPAAQK
jgi:flagellar basal body-associated protein FliL